MRRITRAGLAALVMTAAPAGAADARPTTWHVDPDGDDGNDGGVDAPLRTIQAAADRVAPGDEVVVHPGVYRSASSGFLVELDRGGSEEAWVTFRSELPGAAIIDGDDNRSSHCWVLLDGARYVRIEGFEVRGCRDAGFHSNDGAQHIEYVHNHVHHIGRLCTDTTSGKTGFYQGTGAAYHTYDGNRIHDIGRFGPGESGCDPDTEYYENHDHGMYLNASHVLVVNNVFHDLTHGWPIHIYGSASKQDIAIVNNTFAFANPHRDGHVLLTAGTSGVLIANNVFHRPTAGGVAIGSCTGIADVAIHHNLTDEGAIVAGQSCGFAIGDNQVDTDPLLADPAGLDFRLRVDSPAIDRGAAGAPVPATDAVGTPRPQGPAVDIGAFEVVVIGDDAGSDGDAGTDASDGGPDQLRGEGDGDGGGACAAGGGAPPSLAGLLVLLAAWPRRRRGGAARRALLVAMLAGCSSPAGGGDGGGPDAGTARPVDAAPSAPDASAAPVLVPAVDVSVWTRTLTDPDVDCLWELGYRHVIAGTQLLEVTREQLAIARRGGMTVDLYVYLYWSESIADQVAEAVALAEEFPAVGRIWLDVEDDPGGRGPAALRGLIGEAIAALGDAPGGIYTGQGWWQSYLEDTDAYAEQPLWYARYDGEATLDGWSDPAEEESFGGWTAPTGKQYADYHVHTCGLPVDLNVIWVAASPEVVVDRSTPADDGTPPGAPTGLWPDGGVRVTTEYVRPTAPAIREATSYEIELQSWDGSRFDPYWTTSQEVSAVTVFPVYRDRAYRWRMRAKNRHGFGPWSAWASFDFGAVTSHPS